MIYIQYMVHVLYNHEDVCYTVVLYVRSLQTSWLEPWIKKPAGKMKCQMKIYMFLPNCCCTCEIVTALVSHGSLTSLSAPPWLGLDAVGFKDDDDYLTSAPMELMSTEYNDEWKVTLWISLCLDWILLNIYSNALVLRAQIELMQNKSNISTLMFIQGHWSGR